ncbi:MAG: hypothetical protein QM755_15135, partial [Luteolibacter sp.]
NRHHSPRFTGRQIEGRYRKIREHFKVQIVGDAALEFNPSSRLRRCSNACERRRIDEAGSLY